MKKCLGKSLIFVKNGVTDALDGENSRLNDRLPDRTPA